MHRDLSKVTQQQPPKNNKKKNQPKKQSGYPFDSLAEIPRILEFQS